MANNTVAITLTIDEANALKAWTNQQAAVEKLKQKLAALKAPENPLGSVQAGAMKAMSTLGQVAVALTGIGSVIAGIMALANQLKAEYENIKSRQSAASRVNIDYGKEITRAVAATKGEIRAPEMERLVSRGSQATGLAPTIIAQNYNAVFTTAGPRNKQEALGAMEVADAVAMQYPGEDAQTIADVTQVTAHNKRAFGLTTQQALGYQQQAQNVSPVKNTANFANNVAGKLSALALAGDMSEAEAAAFSGTLAQAGGDREGATSMMAAITMANEMKERLPNIKTHAERLAYFQNNPRAQRAYFEGGTIEGKKFNPAETGRSIYRPHVAEMFNPNSQISTEYNANLQSFGGKAEWERGAATVRSAVAESQSVQVGMAQRQFEAVTQQLQIDDASGAMASVVRDGIKNILQASGATDIEQKYSQAVFEMNTGFGSDGALESAIADLRGREEGLLQTYTSSYVSAGVGAPGSEARSYKSPEQIESDKKKAQRIAAARARLEKIKTDFAASQGMAAGVGAPEPAGVVVAAKPPSGKPTAEQLLKEAEQAVADYAADTTPTAEELHEARRKVKRAGAAVNENAVANLNVLGGGNSPQQIDQYRKLTESMDRFSAALDANTEATQRNNATTEENTKTMPKPGTTPTPRPPNVSSLQNKRS